MKKDDRRSEGTETSSREWVRGLATIKDGDAKAQRGEVTLPRPYNKQIKSQDNFLSQPFPLKQLPFILPRPLILASNHETYLGYDTAQRSPLLGQAEQVPSGGFCGVDIVRGINFSHQCLGKERSFCWLLPLTYPLLIFFNEIPMGPCSKRPLESIILPHPPPCYGMMMF